MDLSQITKIIQSLPHKQQRLVQQAANFDQAKSYQVIYQDIIDTAMSLCRNAHNKDILAIYKTMPVSDEQILESFGKWYEDVAPMSFLDNELDFIKSRVYRNMEGNFRIIPLEKDLGTDSIPPDGLLADETIIQSELTHARTLADGKTETFNGLKALQEQQYEPPYDGVYKDISSALTRLTIQSTFDGTPMGFYKKDNRIYRNIISKTIEPDKRYINDKSLRRAMFLMYLVSGATIESWGDLYSLLHYMTNVPNSSMGYILYLNDFEAGGNGKSKFVQLIANMFGDSFTAFEPHQLRFNMGLMGKRVVSISEFENNEAMNELLSMIKSMTGRDKFQYEGKGVNPIVSDTHQNFIITSNRYVYFEDNGIKRRLQNFHCSNLLHLLLNKHFRTPSYLNPLMGNSSTSESSKIAKEMAHSLLHFILNDKATYDINIRPQDFVLGNLNNPVLRAMFREKFYWNRHIRRLDGKTRFDIATMDDHLEPKEINYAAKVICEWLPELVPHRDNTFATTDMSSDELIDKLKAKVAELDQSSRTLKDKNQVYLQYGQLGDFDVASMLYEFFGEQIDAKDVPCTETEEGVTIC